MPRKNQRQLFIFISSSMPKRLQLLFPHQRQLFLHLPLQCSSSSVYFFRCFFIFRFLLHRHGLFVHAKDNSSFIVIHVVLHLPECSFQSSFIQFGFSSHFLIYGILLQKLSFSIKKLQKQL
jgi:hypothetical protein